jgi:hypothetical protein
VPPRIGERQAPIAALRAAPQRSAMPAVVARRAGSGQELQRRVGNAGLSAALSGSVQRTAAPQAQRATESHLKIARSPAGVRVSLATDPAEQEAEAVAKRAMAKPRAPAQMVAMPPRVPPAAPASPNIARSTALKPGAAPELDHETMTQLEGSRGGGAPLPRPIRHQMEHVLHADFSGVRIHTDERAARLANRVGAVAFAYGRDVYFARGAYSPETRAGGELLAHELVHTIQQRAAIQRRGDTEVAQRTPREVHRFGIDDVRDFLADKANAIPGFRMFTIVLGVNPITMSPVDRSIANILRAVVEFIPGGLLITQALDAYGIFDRVGGWVDQQLRTLGITGAAIKAAVSRFIDGLGVSDIFSPGDVWQRAVSIFSDPIDRIKAFLGSLASAVLDFVRDAILRPLANLASQTRGWDLLIAVLGRNPITGEAVPRTADTLIGGFMKLIGQEEVWENLKKSNAVPRAWVWFQGVLAGVIGFVSQIPTLFLNALRSLVIADLVALPSAFARVVGVFANFVGQFIGWAVPQVLHLLQIIFEVVAPGVIPYIQKAAGAFRMIIQNPIRFVGNLVRGAKLGLENFLNNFGEHLKAGLIDWLTGSLPGVYIPKAFTLVEVGKFALSVLGITWAQIRGKFVKALGPTGERIMSALETTFDIVVALVRGGPAAVWDLIKEKLTNLKDMVIEGITSFVTDTIVKKAIPKLVAMFIPGAGFISAIISIYDTIMVFVQKLSKIAAAVAAFINSIAAIAAGQIEGAARKVETTLAGLLTLAISFLAGFLGLGNIASKVMGVIEKVRGFIDKALDTAVTWIVGKAKGLVGRIAQAGVPQDPAERLRLGKQAAVTAVNRFAGKPVGAAVLQPLLAAIRVRYGFTRLEAVPKQGRWTVAGRINPEFDEVTDALSPEALVSPAGERTLLLGEGNFSFALSIALKTTLGPQIVATDYNVQDRTQLKTASEKTAEAGRVALANDNIAKLQSLGAEVERQVNATDARQYPSGQFQIIVFNHPFAVAKDDKGRNLLGGEKANRELIAGFVTAAKQKLKEGGQIVIISSRFRLSRWRLDQMAESLSLDLVLKTFSPQDYEGYVHEKTLRGESAPTVVTEEQFAVVLTIKAVGSG